MKATQLRDTGGLSRLSVSLLHTADAPSAEAAKHLDETTGTADSKRRGEFMAMRKRASLVGLASVLMAVSVTSHAQTAVTTTGGTTNVVPLFTGSATVGNSSITESNGNVGITLSGSSPLLTVEYGSLFLATGDTNGGMYVTSGQANPKPYQMGYRFGQDSAMVQRGMLYDQASGSVNLINVYGSSAYIETTVVPRVTVMPNGYVGIGTGIPATTPPAMLEVGFNAQMDGNITMTGKGSSITFQDGTVQSTAYTGVTCGGDYAESVDVAGDRKNYEPGDVLVIGPEDGADVVKSAEPYSTLVAGVFSTKPGVVGRRQTTDAKLTKTEIPMAMVGIVPTKVSAENGPIKRGDLLVTSSTLGYAMKGSDPNRMQGAVVGKALGALNSNKGVIEVLVTLQ